MATHQEVLSELQARWLENHDQTFGQLLEGLAPLDVLVALTDEQLIELAAGDLPAEDIEIANLQARAAAFGPDGQLVVDDEPVDDAPTDEPTDEQVRSEW